MKIVFRTDSSLSIGSGHLIRCLNLALLLGDHEIIFLSRDLSQNINHLVTQAGFKLITLQAKEYKLADSVNETEEIKQHLSILNPDIIIVDHYGLGAEWERVTKEYCKKLIAIDDIGRKHVSDIILDQNFMSQTPENYTKSNAKLFLGPKYCLLGMQFFKTSYVVRSFENVSKILVFFGGADQKSMTLRLGKLISEHFKQLECTLIVGSQNQDLEELKAISKEENRIKMIVNTPEIAKYMQEADLFIGAGGTTNWERAKLGLPSLVISTAENQEKISQDLSKENIIKYLGACENVSDEQLVEEISSILKNHSLLKKLSENSLNLKVSSELTSFIQSIL